MGLSWQQGPLAPGATGRYPVFEPGKIEVHLDGARLRLEPGQSVIPHGADRDLTTDEAAPGRKP